MKKVLIATVAAAALLLGGSTSAGAQDAPTQNIVEIAQGNADLSTLVTAVSAAGLVDTLSGPGPFTVFAPTNAAFDALPAGTLDALLADPTGQLADILKLHVLSGAVSSEQAIAAAGGNVDTLGGPVAVELRGADLYVGGAKVVTTDIQATNGVIHVLDAVITAPATPAPNGVDSGNAGIAAESTTNTMLFGLLMGGALLGIGASSVSLVRARRQD